MITTDQMRLYGIILATALTILALAIAFFVVVRTKSVEKFRINIIELCFDFDRKQNYAWPPTWHEINNKLAPFYEMVWSTKKLTLENWLDSADIEKITNKI